MTVRETLTFAASLRLPKSVDQVTREEIVSQTIIELGLKEVENVLVGGMNKKGISGGEKRRLSIGCILVTLPSILILDEPTTGLDSTTAYQLLETLARLARRGRVVILSIHQPRSDAVQLFDKILLLSGGSTIFSGPTSNILSHFKSQGFEPSSNTNPLDFVVDISSIDTRDDVAEAESRITVGKLVRAWREKELRSKSDEGEEIDEITLSPTLSTSSSTPNIAKLSHNITDGTNSEKLPQITRLTSRNQSLIEEETLSTEDRANYLVQTQLLTIRGFKNIRRNYSQLIGFLAQSIIIGLVLGLAFLNPPETPSGIQSLKTVVYMSTPGMFYLTIIVYVYILTEELVIFDREREDNLYSTISYVIGSWLSYLPGNIFFPTLYAVIIYFMCGFWRQNLTVNVLSFIAQVRKIFFFLRYNFEFFIYLYSKVQVFIIILMVIR